MNPRFHKKEHNSFSLPIPLAFKSEYTLNVMSCGSVLTIGAFLCGCCEFCDCDDDELLLRGVGGKGRFAFGGSGTTIRRCGKAGRDG